MLPKLPEKLELTALVGLSYMISDEIFPVYFIVA